MSKDVPRIGDLFQHIETKTVAAFRGWVYQPVEIGGQALMVLHHDKFGECRWPPAKAKRWALPLPGRRPEQRETKWHA